MLIFCQYKFGGWQVWLLLLLALSFYLNYIATCPKSKGQAKAEEVEDQSLILYMDIIHRTSPQPPLQTRGLI
jgi:hypothetical protein